MEDINYSKLDYFNQTFCPECGKLLKGTAHMAYSSGLADWDADYPEIDHWATYRCKDCKISASTKEYNIGEIEAWKFPKGFEPTVTKKQCNYINYLADHFHNIVRDRPIITNKELAARWIGQFVKLLEDEKRDNLNDEAIIEIFKKHGFQQTCYTSRKNEHEKLEFYSMITDSQVRRDLLDKNRKFAYVNVFYDKTTKEVLFESESLNLDLDQATKYMNALSDTLKRLKKVKEDIKNLAYPSEQAGKDRLEADKAKFKKLMSDSSYRDYEYDDYYNDYQPEDFF